MVPMKKSTFVPLILLVYLGVMSYIGRGEFLPAIMAIISA